MKNISDKTSRLPVKKTFLLFSGIFFLVISLTAIAIFTISTRQANQSHIEQQLVFASETMRLRLATSVNSELSLALNLADSPFVRDYFKNPSDQNLELLARKEFDLYERHFKQGVVFWINDIDKIFYSTGNEPYVLHADDPESYWYNLTLYNTEQYNFNINYNPNVQRIYLWVNAPVFDDDKKPLGMLGTAIDLTSFSNFIANAYREFEINITAYTFNNLFEITSARDLELVNNKVRLDEYFPESGEQIIETAAMLSPGEKIIFTKNKKTYLVSSIPEMGWYAVINFPQYVLFALNQSMNMLFFSMLLLFLFILIVLNIFIARSENAIEKQNLRLTEANVKTEAANQSKSNFLATMSHEIRTPLNAILGITQIELQNEDLPDRHMSAYEKIHSSGINLLGIINDILDLTKIETGKMELNPYEYDVPSLINDAIQLNIIRIGSKPVDFKLSVDRNLPSTLIGDEIRIKQILNNLLSNAIKYTEKGEIQLSVKHLTINDNVMLILSVSDTGQGMKEEDKIKVFDEYARFNTEANRSIEGTGLGLNIIKRIVEMMEGDINVESEFGKGSTFTVMIKQQAANDSPIGEELAQRLSDFTFTNKKQNNQKIEKTIMPYGSVLVVDDVEINLYVACEILLSYKLDVEMADSGIAAIEKITNGEKFDVIFMDHMMPKMDGIETTKRLRELGYTGFIVALTANALVGNDKMFENNGFDEFLPKPIDLNQLDTILNKFIRDMHPEEAKKYKSQTISD
ncbi:MAG: ATP-binding protein [Treponema sp.]|nr:ATP-binding protein [Treponema sp.]MCL2236929.1 ATP-binding protein [Treponema sp.]